MIPNYLSEIWAAVAPAVANHLWQSTVFAVIAGLLTLALRKNQARARYWLWLAASVKFLVPFSLLVGIGSHLGRPSGAAGVQSGAYFAMEEVSQPFTQPARSAVSAPASASAAPSLIHLLPAILWIVWLCGFVAVLFVWYVRWRRMSAALRGAVPLQKGREIEALRRIERLAGIRKRIAIFLSRASLEPGILGIIRPVLVWPEGISEHLEDAHLEAILAHEVWHVRRQDNLAGALHMLVEALFWFHPLVWWLGGRLVEERERACDEAVLQSGSKPQVYAESILKTCEFYVGSTLVCVSGVTGADLKNRILRIMTQRGGLKLDLRKKLLLGVAALVAVGVPIVFGLAHGQQSGASSPAGAATGPAFEVASIKPTQRPRTSLKFMFRVMDPANDGRFYANGPTLRMLLRIAYDVQDSQIVGGPSWINTDRFDIEAKADDSLNERLKKLSPAEGLTLKHRMLQALLTDRFKLTINHETKDLPVYALVVAKNGPKMQAAKDDGPRADSSGPRHLGGPGGFGGEAGPQGPRGGVMMRMQAGGAEQQIHFEYASMPSLAEILSQQLGRTVLDKTGLKGKYNFTLKFAPDMAQMRMMGGPGPGGGPEPGGGGGAAGNASEMAPASDSPGPSIFTAIQEQLGLKLKPGKGPVEVLVIEHIEPPTPN